MINFKNLKSKILLIASPVENDSNEKKWERFEKTSGINFPLEYKKYIDTYGTGCLAELVWVLNPFSKTQRFNLLSFLEVKRRDFLMFEQKTNDNCPYQLFSQGKGILPFAFTDNGDTFYWKIDNNKSTKYEILIFDSRQPLIEEYKMGFSEFLLEILDKSFKSNILNLGDIKNNEFKPQLIQ